MKESIETRVKALVSRHFNLPLSKVRLDAAFVGDLGGDPLDLIELGYQLEAAFDISIPSPRPAPSSPVSAHADLTEEHNVLVTVVDSEGMAGY